MGVPVDGGHTAHASAAVGHRQSLLPRDIFEFGSEGKHGNARVICNDDCARSWSGCFLGCVSRPVWRGAENVFSKGCFVALGTFSSPRN
jgi:hypothetical protein